MPIALDACAERDDVGGKARTLARLRAAGLRAPDGFVVLPREVTSDDALAAELLRIGPGPYAVRSSADLEDRAGLSAAGVFESVIGARNLDSVTVAIERVRASAMTEAVSAYLEARGAGGAPPRVAVLVQPVVAAARLGVARSRDDGGFLVEERSPTEPEWGDVSAHDADAALADGLRAIQRLLGVPVDVEYARAAADGTIIYLQARPRSGGGERAADAPFDALEGDWRLDAEHNPAPLSAAQAGLVAWVDALGVGPRQRVVHGWLYVARGAGTPPSTSASPAVAAIPLPQLAARFANDVRPDCDARLLPVEQSPDLEPALAVFAHVYRRYVGEVAPSLARARAQLDQLLRSNLGESLAAHGALLGGLGGLTVARDQALWELGRAGGDSAALAAYLARFGAYAPAWDVVVAPDGEAPERVLDAAHALAAGRAPAERAQEAEAAAHQAAHALLERLDRMARRAFKAVLELARQTLPIAEDDDLLFFRAQRVVRRALLGVGRALAFAGRLPAPEDVFELPLDVTRAAAVALTSGASASDAAIDLAELADTNRDARDAAERIVPPIAIDAGRPRWPRPRAQTVLRGHGTSGRARGRAFVVRSPADAPAVLPEGAVLIVPALLPSLAHLLAGARALVTDHGGAASHGATLAREYAVPAVLGCGRASAIADGADLYVDGAGGRVYVLTESSTRR
jgi:rifampicin phosphotransferase